jgi:hypothetical protein
MGEASRPAMISTAPAEKRRRWGLRALGCCLLVITAVVVSVLQGHHTVGTLGCTVLGIGYGIYCSVRGIQDLVGLEWYRRRLAAQAQADRRAGQ